MLRVSKMADYAVVVLVRLADHGAVQTTPALASATGVPEPTVAKVLKLMTADGLVSSARGARGGYRVARPLSQISVADVVDAIDGPVALTACIEGAGIGCEASGHCAMHGRWVSVNDAVRAALASVSLADMRVTPHVPAAHPALAVAL